MSEEREIHYSLVFRVDDHTVRCFKVAEYILNEVQAAFSDGRNYKIDNGRGSTYVLRTAKIKYFYFFEENR